MEAYTERAQVQKSMRNVIHPLIFLFALISGLFSFVIVVSGTRAVIPDVSALWFALNGVSCVCVIYYMVDHIRTEKFFSQRLLLVAPSPFMLFGLWFVVLDVQRFATVSLVVNGLLFCLAFNKDVEQRYQKEEQKKESVS